MSFQTEINTFHLTFPFYTYTFCISFLIFEVKKREKCHSQNFSEDFPSHDFPFINKSYNVNRICYHKIYFISYTLRGGGGGVVCLSALNITRIFLSV